MLFTTDINNVKISENIVTLGGEVISSKRFGDVQDGDAWYYFNYDMRGSTTVILKPDGGYKKDYAYDTFGNTTEGGGSFYNETQFTGATYDKSTGMHYMNARYYNPSTGRFLTQDSYTGNPYDPWTQNLYAYCGNNPVNFTDPMGHFFMLLTAAIGAVAGAVVGGIVAAVSGEDILEGALIGAAVGGVVGLTGGAAASVMATAGSITGATVFASTATVMGTTATAAGVSTVGTTSAVVIGETMTRVKSAAQSIGAGVYQWQNYSSIAKKLGETPAKIIGFAHNAKWIINAMAQKINIVDIGRDVSRQTKSAYYTMEKILTFLYKYKSKMDWK